MAQDKWSEWLLRTRFGGNAALAELMLSQLRRIRDRVLDAADLKPGHTALDIGAGDGLLAFGAAERVGPRGRVILSDISQPLLDHARSIAEGLGVAGRCTFVNAPADRLDGVADASVDVAMTRSVLIYVQDKGAAFREMHRVLRPGGRVSAWEPINRFTESYAPGQTFGGEIDEVRDLAERLHAYFRSLQPMDSDPMLNFDERDLLRACEDAGFRSIRVDVSITAEPAKPAPWDAVMNIAGNPNIPSLAAAMNAIFSDDERRRFEAALRPLVEAGGRVQRAAVAHVIAIKDGGPDAGDLAALP